MKPEIQIWNSFLANISTDILNNNFLIEIEDSAKPLPEELEKKVNDNWNNISLRKKIVDNPILYLESIEEDKNKIIVKTNIRGFRYTQAFNRNPDFYDLTKELNGYHLLSISTHCHLITNDKKILFGTKKNQFNQISGFSGFPNAEEDSVELKGKKYLDTYRTIKKRLYSEIGYLVDAVDDIKAVGITYVDTPALRGTDSDYIVYLAETSDNAKKRFKESSQFERQLFVISFEPKKIIEFIKQISKEKELSKYALGCSYAIMKTYYGQKEATKLLQTIKDLGITISTSNKTNYLSYP